MAWARHQSVMPPAKKPQEAVTDAPTRAAPDADEDAAWLEALTAGAQRLEEMGFVTVIKDTVSDEVAVVPTEALATLVDEIYRDHGPSSVEDGEECLADSIALQAIDKYGTLSPEDLDCILTVAVNAADIPSRHDDLVAGTASPEE